MMSLELVRILAECPDPSDSIRSHTWIFCAPQWISKWQKRNEHKKCFYIFCWKFWNQLICKNLEHFEKIIFVSKQMMMMSTISGHHHLNWWKSMILMDFEDFMIFVKSRSAIMTGTTGMFLPSKTSVSEAFEKVWTEFFMFSTLSGRFSIVKSTGTSSSGALRDFMIIIHEISEIHKNHCFSSILVILLNMTTSGDLDDTEPIR